MSPFWLGLAGILTGLGIVGLGAYAAGKTLGPRLIRSYLKGFMDRVARDAYPENLVELVSTGRKVGVLTLLETVMRTGQKGKPIARPWGAARTLSPWDQLLFNPVHMFRLPAADGAAIRTRIVIGPAARKPLAIDIPIMITGMSYGGALSERAKVALGRAAGRMGTAMCTGEGYIHEEKEAVGKLIVQYHRGDWPHSPQHFPEILDNADAIEIQLGQGGQGSSSQRTPAKNIDERMRDAFGLEPGQDAVIRRRLRGIDDPEDFIPLVRGLRERYGVPVGFKFSATHHQERELEIAVRAGADFVVVDGAEAGTHGGQPILADDMGLPTMHALVRTDDYLRRAGVRDRVSIICAGGLYTPGQFLKAMALGADAIYIGTVAGLAMVGAQMVNSLPGEPPSALIFHMGHLRERFNVDEGVKSLTNFLESCVREMKTATACLGKTSVAEVDRFDLVALDPLVAAMTGVELAHFPPDRQKAVEGRPLWEGASPGAARREEHEGWH